MLTAATELNTNFSNFDEIYPKIIALLRELKTDETIKTLELNIEFPNQEYVNYSFRREENREGV